MSKKRRRSQKHYFDDEEVYYEFEGKKKGKILPTIIVLLVLSAFSLFFVANNTNLLDDIFNRTVVSIGESEVSMDKDFATGLRLASLERYDEAISYFEKVNFNKLSEADQELVLMTYLYSGNEQKALDLKAEIDEVIIKVLLENEDLEKLKELETDSNLIKFEIAILDNDYETIIALKDVERLEKDTRRANAIANAYYKLGNTEEAINYTAMMAHAGINMWETDNKVPMVETADEKVIVENESSGFLSSIMYFLFGAFIALFAHFVILNRNNLKEVVSTKKAKKKRSEKQKKEEDKPRRKTRERKEKIIEKEMDDEEYEDYKKDEEEKIDDDVEDDTEYENNDEAYEEIEIIEYEDGTIEERKIKKKENKDETPKKRNETIKKRKNNYRNRKHKNKQIVESTKDEENDKYSYYYEDE